MPVLSLNPDQWVDAYADSLYSYALKFIPNRDLAQNLVQETFLAGLKNRSSFSGRSSEKTWLIGILKNKILDHLRAKYREIPVSQLIDDEGTIDGFFDDRTGHLAQEPKPLEFNPTHLLENKEFWKTLSECLKHLPSKTGLAFSLREIEAMESQEICKVLGISPTNLWVMLHRARLHLRQCLQANWFDHDQ
jgi:RNA polymerase sigma-70 factor (ECF subfamily)